MVVLPKHPKMIIFSMKTPWLLGKPTILGNTPIYLMLEPRIPRNLHDFFSAASHPERSPSHLTQLDPRSCANSPCWNVAPPGNRFDSKKSESFSRGVGVSLILPLYRGISSQIHPSIHSFIRSFIHSFIRSFIHSFIHSCQQSIPAINPCHAINPSGSESIHSKKPETLEGSLTSPETR